MAPLQEGVLSSALCHINWYYEDPQTQRVFYYSKIYYLQLGCHPVPVVILRVYEYTWKQKRVQLMCRQRTQTCSQNAMCCNLYTNILSLPLALYSCTAEHCQNAD